MTQQPRQYIDATGVTDVGFLKQLETAIAAFPWVCNDGVLEGDRVFSARGVYGFLLLLQNGLFERIEEASIDKCLPLRVARKQMFAYMERSTLFHPYRHPQGTPGELLLAAYMCGINPVFRRRESFLPDDVWLPIAWWERPIPITARNTKCFEISYRDTPFFCMDVSGHSHKRRRAALKFAKETYPRTKKHLWDAKPIIPRFWYP